MNKELAKQLKDAGFTRNRIAQQNYFWDKESEEEEYIEKIIVPTLEELIEECRQFNSDYVFNLESTREGMWWAEMWCFGVLIKQTKGATHKEAVAHLWLALNKK